VRRPPEIPNELQTLLGEQDGAMTTRQAMAAGLTRRQIRTLTESGWGHPFLGVLLEPAVPNPFRTSVRAALLACPSAFVHGVTAGRLYALWGLPIWAPSEPTELILPRGKSFNTRSGLRLHKGLRDDEWCMVDGFPTADLERTVCELSMSLPLDDLVCVVDSAIRKRWTPYAPTRPRRRLHQAIALSDARSESALETYGRLLLVGAGLAPEELQYEFFDDSGHAFARFDMAWPSARLLVEFDGWAHHSDEGARRRDQNKSNTSAIEGWRLLRFTWRDVMRRPEYVLALVRAALGRG
jgi:hypothetical protein